MAVLYSATENYTAGSGNLSLSVAVGNGQYHNTLVMLDGEIIVWGTFPTVAVGKVPDCKNKQLYVEVNATDTNSQTDLVPVTLQLKDSSNQAVFEYENEADVNGGTVLFEIKINIQ